MPKRNSRRATCAMQHFCCSGSIRELSRPWVAAIARTRTTRADRRFVTHFGQEARRRGIPASIRAEIDVAEDQTELSEDELEQVVETFLAADFTVFDQAVAEAAASQPALPAEPDDSSSDEV